MKANRFAARLRRIGEARVERLEEKAVKRAAQEIEAAGGSADVRGGRVSARLSRGVRDEDARLRWLAATVRAALKGARR